MHAAAAPAERPRADASGVEKESNADAAACFDESRADQETHSSQAHASPQVNKTSIFGEMISGTVHATATSERRGCGDDEVGSVKEENVDAAPAVDSEARVVERRGTISNTFSEDTPTDGATAIAPTAAGATFSVSTESNHTTTSPTTHGVGAEAVRLQLNNTSTSDITTSDATTFAPRASEAPASAAAAGGADHARASSTSLAQKLEAFRVRENRRANEKCERVDDESLEIALRAQESWRRSARVTKVARSEMMREKGDNEALYVNSNNSTGGVAGACVEGGAEGARQGFQEREENETHEEEEKQNEGGSAVLYSRAVRGRADHVQRAGDSSGLVTADEGGFNHVAVAADHRPAVTMTNGSPGRAVEMPRTAQQSGETSTRMLAGTRRQRDEATAVGLESPPPVNAAASNESSTTETETGHARSAPTTSL